MWIFGSRTTVKKVRNSLTWFSQKVRVTRIRMILLLHWLLMQNSMSSCKLLMLQWARTLMAKRISLGRSIASSRNWRWFQRDGLGQGYPSSLQTCVDHLDRVLAGCCWEVQATRTTPLESLLSLHRVAKCLSWLQIWPKRLLPFSGRF